MKFLKKLFVFPVIAFCSVCAFAGCGGQDSRLEREAPTLTRSDILISGQSITINGFDDVYYSSDGGKNWVDENIFNSLDFNKTYNFCIMYPATTKFLASKSSNIIAVSLAKTPETTPIIKDENVVVNGNSVAIVGFDNASYSADDGETWTNFNVFNDLINGKTYKFRVKINGTATTSQSEPSRPRFVTIEKLERAAPLLTASNISVDNLKAQIVIYDFQDAIYSIDGGLTFQESNVFEGLSTGKTYKIAVKYVANEMYNESDWSNVIYRSL